MKLILSTLTTARHSPGGGIFSRLHRFAVVLLGAAALGMSGGAACADVYVADNGSGLLLRYTSANNSTVFSSNLTVPATLVFDSAGNLYAGDNGTGSLYKFTPDGTMSTFASGLGRIYGLVFDGGGNLYTSIVDPDSGVGSIVRLAPDGTQTSFATGLTRARGLVFDGAGNLYAADLDSGNVYEYMPAGARTTFASGFNYPTGIAFDASGTLFVCSQGVGVFEVSPAGAISTFTLDVTDPRYLAFDASGNLYVSDVGDASGDQGQGTIYLFAPDGTRSTFASNLAAPLGIALSGNTAASHPAFFAGEAALGNGVYYLAFSNGNYFGYYSYLSDPRYIFHFDLGYEYLFNAADAKSGIYFYDFASQTFFYTSPSFPFPYLYDFSLNAVLYYYPDTTNADHYTTIPRYFYNTSTGQIITK